MHRTLTTPSTIYRQPDPAIKAIARRFAVAPESEHLRMLVELMTAISDTGVDLSQHWDCLCEALILEELQ